jgi:acyl-CoA-binding protein
MQATELVKSLPSDGDDKPSQEEQLEFYALFKQGMYLINPFS